MPLSWNTHNCSCAKNSYPSSSSHQCFHNLTGICNFSFPLFLSMVPSYFHFLFCPSSKFKLLSSHFSQLWPLNPSLFPPTKAKFNPFLAHSLHSLSWVTQNYQRELAQRDWWPNKLTVSIITESWNLPGKFSVFLSMVSFFTFHRSFSNYISPETIDLSLSHSSLRGDNFQRK